MLAGAAQGALGGMVATMAVAHVPGGAGSPAQSAVAAYGAPRPGW